MEDEEEFVVVSLGLAVHDFDAENDAELSFKLGDVVQVLDKDESGEWGGWWEGRVGEDGEPGYFPPSYIREISASDAAAISLQRASSGTPATATAQQVAAPLPIGAATVATTAAPVTAPAVGTAAPVAASPVTHPLQDEPLMRSSSSDGSPVKGSPAADFGGSPDSPKSDGLVKIAESSSTLHHSADSSTVDASSPRSKGGRDNVPKRNVPKKIINSFRRHRPEDNIRLSEPFNFRVESHYDGEFMESPELQLARVYEKEREKTVPVSGLDGAQSLRKAGSDPSLPLPPPSSSEASESPPHSPQKSASFDATNAALNSPLSSPTPAATPAPSTAPAAAPSPAAVAILTPLPNTTPNPNPNPSSGPSPSVVSAPALATPLSDDPPTSARESFREQSKDKDLKEKEPVIVKLDRPDGPVRPTITLTEEEQALLAMDESKIDEQLQQLIELKRQIALARAKSMGLKGEALEAAAETVTLPLPFVNEEEARERERERERKREKVARREKKRKEEEEKKRKEAERKKRKDEEEKKKKEKKLKEKDEEERRRREKGSGSGIAAPASSSGASSSLAGGTSVGKSKTTADLPDMHAPPHMAPVPAAGDGAVPTVPPPKKAGSTIARPDRFVLSRPFNFRRQAGYEEGDDSAERQLERLTGKSIDQIKGNSIIAEIIAANEAEGREKASATGAMAPIVSATTLQGGSHTSGVVQTGQPATTANSSNPGSAPTVVNTAIAGATTTMSDANAAGSGSNASATNHSSGHSSGHAEGEKKVGELQRERSNSSQTSSAAPMPATASASDHAES